MPTEVGSTEPSNQQSPDATEALTERAEAARNDRIREERRDQIAREEQRRQEAVRERAREQGVGRSVDVQG